MNNIDLTLEFSEDEEGVYISVTNAKEDQHILVGFISNHALLCDDQLKEKMKSFFEDHIKRSMAKEGIKHSYTVDLSEKPIDKSKLN